MPARLVKNLQKWFLAANCPVQVLEHGGIEVTSSTDCTSFDETGVCAVNSTLLYRCLVHKLLGNSVVTCTENNTWYPPLGTCQPGEYYLYVCKINKFKSMFCVILTDDKK